jgi:hypothetical protein
MMTRIFRVHIRPERRADLEDIVEKAGISQ